MLFHDAEAELVAADTAVGLTSESQVAAERAVNVVGAEAKPVVAERAVGLTSES